MTQESCGKGRLDPLVNPNGDVLRRRIFEAGDLVQAMMIELREQRPERLFDREEIDDEAGRRIDRSFELEFDAIGMAVHVAAAMRRRDVGQEMRGLEGKGLGDLHGSYGKPMSLWVCRLSRQRGCARQ